MTQNLDLYYSTTKDNKFYFYKIEDLEHLACENSSAATKQWSHTPIFSYDAKLVSGQPIYQMWVKGAVSEQKSQKTSDKTDTRFFILHRHDLMSCIEGEQPEFITKVKHAKQAQEGNLYYSSPRIKDKMGQVTQIPCVNRVAVVFSDLKIDKIYEEQRPDVSISNLSLDLTLNRVYVLTKHRILGETDYQIIIVDTVTFQVLYKLDVTGNKLLIGQLKSGMHFLINGNFYYQNQLMRFDPLNPQHVLFTRYEDIMPVQAMEEMIFVSPKASLHHRRLLYIKKDLGGGALRTAYVMPFLDERKIVLKCHSKHTQLWMLIEGSTNEDSAHIGINRESEDFRKFDKSNDQTHMVNQSHSAFVYSAQDADLNLTGPNQSSLDDQRELLNEYADRSTQKGKLRCCKRQKLSRLVPDSNNGEVVSGIGQLSQRIICVNLHGGNFQVYSPKGQLLRVQPFFREGQQQLFGEPIAASQNGTTMLFRNHDNLKLSVHFLKLWNGFEGPHWTVDIENLIQTDASALSILLPDFNSHIGIQGKITGLEKNQSPTTDQLGLNDKLTLDQEYGPNSQKRKSDEFLSLIPEGGEDNLGTTLLQVYNMQVEVNDDGDICLLFIEKKSKSGHYMQDTMQPRTLDQHFDNSHDEIHHEIPLDKRNRVIVFIKRPASQQQQARLVVLHNHRDFNVAQYVKNFVISRECVYFWNRESVYYYRHSNAHNSMWDFHFGSHNQAKIEKIAFSIPSEDLRSTAIKNVCVSGREHRDEVIVIKVSVNPKQNTIIIWDLKQDIEADSYDVTPEAQVMFNSKGELYILENDHIIINKSGGRCFAYQLDGNGYLSNSVKLDSGKHNIERLDRGSRVDAENQNFLIVRNNLHLGHSYLAILINEQNALKEFAERVFDPLAFPYYLNRQSELHHLVNDPASLELVLSFYEASDPRLLDHILLSDHQKMTPLHIAGESEVSKSLNLLLKKLSIVRVNNTSNFKDIFESFLDYFFFKDYLNTCFFQTLQMKAIQSLSIPHSEAQDESGCAAVTQHTNTFMSQALINRVLDPDSPSQPVVVKGFDLHWILNTEEGTNFLHKLSQLDNADFFTTEFVKTLIYFLWSYYKTRIIWQVMLPYCAYFGLFITLVFYNENYFQASGAQNTDGSWTTTTSMVFTGNQYHVMVGLCIALLVLIAYFSYLQLRTCLTLGRFMLTNFWIYCNIISNIINLAITLMTLFQQNTLFIRRLESVTVQLMWFRWLYFFRILDSTAPLIRMIFQIMYDMRSFMFIFLIFILAFGNGFYVLAQNQMDLVPGATDNQYMTYPMAMLYVYQIALDNFGEAEYVEGTNVENGMLWAFFSVTAFILMIVLLNLLIAMMGQSFSRVMEVAESSMLNERIQLIMENFFLKRSDAFIKAKYLFSFAPIKEEDSQDTMMQNITDSINHWGRELKGDIQQIRLAQTAVVNSNGGIPGINQGSRNTQQLPSQKSKQ